jgi:protein TonB
MEPSTILRSDALDILFENRNKQYGAYTLRREYPRRLLLAVGGMALVVATVLFFMLQPQAPRLLAGPILIIEDHHLVPPPPPSLPEPPPPAATAPPVPPAATVQYVKPEIVPDELYKDPLPEMKDLDNKLISTETIEGPVSDGLTRPPQPENTGTGAAPIPPAKEEAPAIRETAAVMPSFPGGLGALQRWLSKNLRPQDGIEPGQRVKVIARFVVDVNGTITGIRLTQTGGDPYDQEVLRVINKMPKWNPGRQNGETVAVWFNIPIIFTSQEE